MDCREKSRYQLLKYTDSCAEPVKVMIKQTKPLSFCISLCSRQRPVLLARALGSLSMLKIPENTRLSFLVVENNESWQYGSIIAEFGKNMPITHVLEPRPGLTFARNKILETLVDLDVDWMGGVDDDQIIDPVWLEKMVAAIRKFPDTKMFTGDWHRSLPADMPNWYPVLNRPAKMNDGSKMGESATGNIAMHRSVFDPADMALRFDPAYNLLGGEDLDFSAQYLNKGGIIRFVKNARTDEEIHDGRATLTARLERASASEYILAKVRHRRKSAINAYGWTLQILYRSVVFGIANLILAGASFVFAPQWAKQRYGVSLRFFARIRGLARYYFGKQPAQYASIKGN